MMLACEPGGHRLEGHHFSTFIAAKLNLFWSQINMNSLSWSWCSAITREIYPHFCAFYYSFKSIEFVHKKRIMFMIEIWKYGITLQSGGGCFIEELVCLVLYLRAHSMMI